jgi:hypothetical protein
VRRMEGTLLHPTRDTRGVHWFRVAEVQALVRCQGRGELNLFRLPSAVAPQHSDAPSHGEAIVQLAIENEDLRRQIAELVEEIDELANA